MGEYGKGHQWIKTKWCLEHEIIVVDRWYIKQVLEYKKQIGLSQCSLRLYENIISAFF